MPRVWRRGYTKRDGTRVRGHWVDAPGGRGRTGASQPQQRRPQSTPDVYWRHAHVRADGIRVRGHWVHRVARPAATGIGTAVAMGIVVWLLFMALGQPRRRDTD